MNITDLLSPQYDDSHHSAQRVVKPAPQLPRPIIQCRQEPALTSQSALNNSSNSSIIPITPAEDHVDLNCPVHDEDLHYLLKVAIHKAGFNTRMLNDRNSLTDAILSPINTPPPTRRPRSNSAITDIPVHIKVIGRHMNGSYRCHIGTSKASRPIQSTELSHEMRLMAVFFRSENAKSQIVSPEFIFFPTWLLHLFRYTQHEATPGRTDVRFLENANMAKEDHIYRLNHILNTLFRFNIKNVDADKLKAAIELGQFLFDTAGLDYRNLPPPIFFRHLNHQQQQRLEQPAMYPALLLLLHASRPKKLKPMCHNCNTKPASRRRLCVACYRYQLKHGESRPLRLIVANRPGPRSQGDLIHSRQLNSRVMTSRSSSPSPSPFVNSNNGDHDLSVVFFAPTMTDVSGNRRTSASSTESDGSSSSSSSVSISSAGSSASTTVIQRTRTITTLKFCANCKVKETHQWYRNLCGEGNWCETCKSYYLRHAKVRPPELFVKAAKRKVDIRSLVRWNTWSWDDIPVETIEAATMAYFTSTPTSSSVLGGGRKSGEQRPYNHQTLVYNHDGATAAAAMMTMSSGSGDGHTGLYYPSQPSSRLDEFYQQPAFVPNLPTPGARQRRNAITTTTLTPTTTATNLAGDDDAEMIEMEATSVSGQQGPYYQTTPPLSDHQSLRGSTSPSSRSSTTSETTLVGTGQPFW